MSDGARDETTNRPYYWWWYRIQRWEPVWRLRAAAYVLRTGANPYD
jgi:hypothetical protein